MKKTILLLFLLSTLSISSQSLFNTYEEGTVFFKDGTTAEGILKITSNDKIKFKINPDANKELFDHDIVDKVKLFYKGEFFYKKVKKRFYLLRKEVKGKLELFSKEKKSMSGVGIGVPITANISVSYVYSPTKYDYYIGNADSNTVDEIADDWFKGKFRKTMAKYTSDCKKFTSLIQNEIRIENTFNSSLHKMVEFYNTRCD